MICIRSITGQITIRIVS